MVTRPAHQAGQLTQLLEQAGARVYYQPLIEITTITSPSAAIEQVKNLDKTQIAIFISQNAVTHGIQLIQDSGTLPEQVKLATVGLGSATLLEKLAKRRVEIMPASSYSSEGLLAHPALQNVEGQKITIFRGLGGRNLLADTLRKRGAQVDYAEVYRRTSPIIDTRKLATAWDEQAIDAICITSGEGLENLMKAISNASAPKKLQTNILTCPLVIVNHHLQPLVKKLGFSKAPIITNNVSDNAIVDAIINYHF